MRQEIQSLQEKNTCLESVLQQIGVMQYGREDLQVSAESVHHSGLQSGPDHGDAVSDTVSHFH
jgi:hypothetical protein